MTGPAARHVVDRCPSCGLEHDVRVHACEACHTPLRYWCRRHGREAGWLDTPACPRCAQEAARPAPPPRPSTAPAPAKPPAPSRPPEAPAPAPRREPSPWPGGRSPREILRGGPRAGVRRGREEPRPQPRLGFALMDAVGIAIAWMLIGMVGGSVLALFVGAERAAGARLGAAMIGLGGLVVGLMRGLAIAMAERDVEED